MNNFSPMFENQRIHYFISMLPADKQAGIEELIKRTPLRFLDLVADMTESVYAIYRSDVDEGTGAFKGADVIQVALTAYLSYFAMQPAIEIFDHLPVKLNVCAREDASDQLKPKAELLQKLITVMCNPSSYSFIQHGVQPDTEEGKLQVIYRAFLIGYATELFYGSIFKAAGESPDLVHQELALLNYKWGFLLDENTDKLPCGVFVPEKLQDFKVFLIHMRGLLRSFLSNQAVDMFKVMGYLYGRNSLNNGINRWFNQYSSQAVGSFELPKGYQSPRKF